MSLLRITAAEDIQRRIPQVAIEGNPEFPCVFPTVRQYRANLKTNRGLLLCRLVTDNGYYTQTPSTGRLIEIADALLEQNCSEFNRYLFNAGLSASECRDLRTSQLFVRFRNLKLYRQRSLTVRDSREVLLLVAIFRNPRPSIYRPRHIKLLVRLAGVHYFHLRTRCKSHPPPRTAPSAP